MEDYDIIDLFWNRNETAIAETSKKYDRYCKHIAANFLDDFQDVEECVNDTYLGAWNAIPDARPNIFRVFLGKITRNISLNKFDYNTSGKRNQNLSTLLSELEDCLPSNSSVEQEILQNETIKDINNFLISIDDEARNIFLLRYWHGYSILELSKNFLMSESKIKSLLFRLRNKLKSYLEKEGTIF